MSQFHNAFKRSSEEKKTDTFTVKLNSDERLWLEGMKKLLQQEKDSTALKQLASIGSKVLLDKKTSEILELVMNNYRKNKRLGIVTFEQNVSKSDAFADER